MKFRALRIPGIAEMPIVPAPTGREWAEAMPYRAAMRCPVLPYASAGCWLVLCPVKFSCLWNGSQNFNAVKFSNPCNCTNVTGGPIINFALNYVFEVEEGYELLIRSVSNLPKNGVTTLEALVDCDLAASVAGIHSIITRPNKRITFEAGEPVAALVPQKRGELELFEPSLGELKDNPSKEPAYRKWCARRLEIATKHAAGIDTADFKGGYHKAMAIPKRRLRAFK